MLYGATKEDLFTIGLLASSGENATVCTSGVTIKESTAREVGVLASLNSRTDLHSNKSKRETET